MNPAHRTVKKLTYYSCLALLFTILAPHIFAADAGLGASQFQPADASQAAASPINSGDNAWLLASSALVLMMTAPGLILFYGGLVRTKNVLSTMMHSLILMALISALWMVFGYSMAFAPGNAFCGNPLTHFMLKGVGAAPNPDYAATIPSQTFMLFQMMFAIITPALISGAVAESSEIQGVCRVHAGLDGGGLFSAVPHGLGRRRLFQLGLRRQNSRAGLRGRHGRPYQFRRVGAGVCVDDRQARRLSA